MSIETEINRISTNVSNTLSAVSEMGGEVPEGATSNDMAAGVRSIPVGAKIDDTTPSTSTTYSSSKIESKLTALNEANAQQDQRLTTLEQAGGIVTVEPAEGDVPLLFYSAALPQTKTDTAMPISYVSKTLKREDADAKTKAQGNSSLSYAKKNQTTKFSQAFNFKGWGLQKKYCMKANWIDLTHARNIVSAQLWGDVVKSRANYADLPELLRTSPNQGAIDGFPALVYANGVYQGRYTINIPKDGWMANMDKTLDTHCILCGENYVSGCFRAAANINGSDWSDELHDIVPDAIKTRWNEVISFVMNSTDAEFKANLGNYFYVDSLIDYLLFALASCGLDSMGKNQLYMTYDGQKWIASMYDMDSTWGLYWNGSSFVASDYARTSYEDYVSGREGNLLYIRLEQNFHAEIQARWAELKAGPLSYANIMTRFERFIGIVPPHIVKEDYASTTGGGSFTGIPSQSTNHIQQIRAFAIARQAWTDEYVAALTPEVTIPCTGITLDQTTLTFTAAGTQTLTATVTPSNTTDAVMWSSDAPSIASVSGGVVTAKANGSATITATCGAYSATCAVSVSGIESGGNTPSEDILYQLAEPMTFNGTSDYIDTGVKLLESDIDHSIVFSAVAGTGNITNDAIFHCMTEASPYPGYAFAVVSGGNYKLCIPGGQEIITNVPKDNASFKVVITHIKGSSTVNMKILYNGEVKTYIGNNSNYVTVPQNLLIGCYQTTSGGLGRYWNGTINDFRIYNRVLSDEEITAYLSTPCTGITLDQTELTFSASGTQTLIATVTPSNTTDTVVWSSDAPSIASVSNGVVTAIANGSATITATCGAYSATCAVSVSGIESGSDSGIVWSNTPEYSISTGSVVSGANYVTPEPIAVPAFATIEMSNNGGSYSYLGVAQYKSDMTFISYSESGNTTDAYTVVLNGGAKYVRLSAYNNKSASNNHPDEQINVSISELVYGTNNTIYELAAPATFDGVSDYIDTGVQLLKTDADYTIMFSMSHSAAQSVNRKVFNCMGFDRPWPGIEFTSGVSGSDSTDKYTCSLTNSVRMDTAADRGQETASIIAVIRHHAASNRYHATYLYNGEISTDGATVDFVSIDNYLLLGCGMNASGVTENYWSGTIDRFVVLSGIASEDDITAFFSN